MFTLSALVSALMFVGAAIAAPDPEPQAAEAPADGGEVAAAEAGDEPEKGEEAEKTQPEGPLKVTIGVHINDVQAIDMTTHSYSLDAYVWLRWEGDEVDPSTTLEFTNGADAWGHVLTPLYEEPETLEDGSHYQVLRITGRFSKKMPLHDYPFDQQVIEIGLEDTQLNLDGLMYVPGDPAATVSPDLTLPGYEFGAPVLNIQPFQYPTTFGDPRLDKPETHSRAVVQMPIARPIFAYSIKLLLPFLCATACAALMFLLAPVFVDARVSVGITSLLTIVALQMSFNEDLPDVGYLTLMDKLYVCAYLYVIAGLGVVVRTASMVQEGRAEAAVAVHRQGLLALTGAYLIGVAVLVFAAVNG